MKRAKIFIISDGNFPSRFAHSFNVAKMSQAFADCGCDVSLFAPFTLKALSETLRITASGILRGLTPNGSIREHYGIGPEVKFRFVLSPRRDSIRKSAGVNGFVERVMSICRRENPDLIFCRSYEAPRQASLLNFSTAIETHTTLYDCAGLTRLYPIVGHDSFKCLVTISRSIADEHVRRGVPENKVLVLEDGVDLARFDAETRSVKELRGSLDLPATSKIAMYCGHLYPEKGIGVILQMAKALKDRHDVFFCLVGGWPKDVAAWKAKFRQEGISNSIFKGHVPNAVVPSYLKAADVLLLPYDPAVDYRVMDIETTSPLKLFEYMASGVPVLASAIPTVKKVVAPEDGEILASLAEPGSVDSHVEQLLTLFVNPEAAYTMAQTARHAVENFTWKSRAKAVLRKVGLDRGSAEGRSVSGLKSPAMEN